MSEIIVISTPYIAPKQVNTISLEEYQKRRKRRRRRVAKRQAKRFPLFAVEFMKSEFPDYNHDDFIEDIQSGKKGKKRKGKSQLKRYGRYPLYEKALYQYEETKDPEYLYQAQRWRKKMLLPFEVEYKLGREKRTYTFAATTSMSELNHYTKITFTSFEDLEAQLKDLLKYSGSN